VRRRRDPRLIGGGVVRRVWHGCLPVEAVIECPRGVRLRGAEVFLLRVVDVPLACVVLAGRGIVRSRPFSPEVLLAPGLGIANDHTEHFVGGGVDLGVVHFIYMKYQNIV